MWGEFKDLEITTLETPLDLQHGDDFTWRNNPVYVLRDPDARLW